MHFTKGKHSLRNDEFQKNEKRYRYGIRKLGLGAASVILGAFLFAGVPTVSATSSVSYEVNTDSTKIDYADAGYSVVAKETPKDFIVKDERENYLTLQIIAEVVSDGTENGKTKWKELDTDYYVVSVNRNDRSLSLSVYDAKTKALKQRTDNIKNGYSATVRGFNNTEDIKLTGGINTRGALTIVIEGPAGYAKRLLALFGLAAGAEPANKISTSGIYVVPQEIFYFYEKDRETIGKSFYNTDFDASAYEQILPKYSQTGLSGDTYTLGDILVNGYRITYRPIETGVLTAAGNFKNDFTNPNYPVGETTTVSRTNYDGKGNDLRIVYDVIDASGTETVKVFLGNTPIPLRKEGTDNQPSDEYVGTVTYSGAGSFAEFVIPSMGNRLLTVANNYASPTTKMAYFYEKLPTGSVIVNYVDTKGTKIGTEFKDTTDGEVGSAYDTTVNTGELTSDKTTERPSVITKDGKTYRLVAQATDATVGQVASDGHLTSNKEGFHYGTDEVKGQVAEGTKSITYVYEEVKGSVIVNYVDTEGTKIGTEFKDTTDGEVGSAYDTTVNTGEVTSDKTTERPSVITKDGKTYRLVAQATDATVGQVATDGHLTS
ncbi:YSIRK-type signal peptide-containing protein, partial [Streptococcus suis]